GTLRKMRGIKLGLEAVALSIVSLGLVDAVAFLPLSISATATSTSAFRIPLLLVVLFGLGACTVLVAGRHLVRLPFVARRARLAAGLLLCAAAAAAALVGVTASLVVAATREVTGRDGLPS